MFLFTLFLDYICIEWYKIHFRLDHVLEAPPSTENLFSTSTPFLFSANILSHGREVARNIMENQMLTKEMLIEI